MDLVFPEFVPASTGVTGAATTARKSLWELVIEASSQQPNIGGVDTFSEQYHRLDREVIPCSKEVTDDSRNFEDEMAAAITPTSRSWWLPSPYMTNNLLPKGFVQQFCTLNSIECSARIPPPPCLRMEDLQFPPFVLARLRKQLLSSSTEKSLAGRVVHPSAEKQCSEAQKPQSVKKAYIGVEATGWSAGQGADGEKIDENEDSGGTVGDVLVLTALQQLTLTSMLLGHHTVSIAPHGTGKKTAGLLAVAGLTLAREVSPGENPPVGGDAAIEQETLATTKASPNGPRAVILFSTYSELQRHAHWLQCVFTCEAFAFLTFQRGSAKVVPLHMHVNHFERPAGDEFGHLKPTSRCKAYPQQSVEKALPHGSGHHTRGHDLSESRHHHHHDRSRSRSRSVSPTSREETRKRYRSRRRRSSRSARRRRGSSRSTNRKRERSLRRHRDSSRSVGGSRRRRRKSRNTRRRSDSRPRDKSVADNAEQEGARDEVGGNHQMNVLPGDEVHVPSSPNPPMTPAVEIPGALRRSVPILLATHQSFADALQEVRGQAELLPLECVRVVCINDADRVAQANLAAAVLPLWWISFSNAVDVDCQYIVSASRMYGEVNDWLRETLLRDTPDTVNRYRQRDDTVWHEIRHVLQVVHVGESFGHQQRQSYEETEEARFRHLTDAVAEHFTRSCDGAVNPVVNNATDVSSFSPPKMSENRVIIMVSSRKEQEALFARLVPALQTGGAGIRCTCQWEVFQHSNADLLVACDWMVNISSGHLIGSNGCLSTVRLLVNYSFPRMILAPGKEENLLECLVHRVRTLVCGYAPALGEERHNERNGAHVEKSEENGRGSPTTVLTLLTERQMYGRIGRLLQQRAEAITLE